MLDVSCGVSPCRGVVGRVSWGVGVLGCGGGVAGVWGCGGVGWDNGGGKLRVCGGLKQETPGIFDPPHTDQMFYMQYVRVGMFQTFSYYSLHPA